MLTRPTTSFGCRVRTKVAGVFWIIAATTLLVLDAAAAKEESVVSARTTSESVEQVHAALWDKLVDRHGIILDFVGAAPTPEDCTRGRPNAIGWWSPIENGAMFTGLYLPAACERARRTGNPLDCANARRLAWGLMKCASLSDVPGFIGRGVGADGKCHYALGSDDQTHPWFYGLHAYVTSSIPDRAEKEQIVAKMKEVANALEATGWKCPCDGAFKGQFRGSFQGYLFRDAVRYLHVLRMMNDVTGDPVWLDRYRKALAECPNGCDLTVTRSPDKLNEAANSKNTRAEICAVGFAFDRKVIDVDHTFWIFAGTQGALAELLAMETDDALRTLYRRGLLANSKIATAGMAVYKKFDNNDAKIFGHADWRSVFTTWFPQETQNQAERLAGTGDRTKAGERKGYEHQFMVNPLAAAAIVALAGDNSNRDAVERVIRHYNYSKLNMAQFFFAECAYYALPVR